jgi:hypothetical protein
MLDLAGLDDHRFANYYSIHGCEGGSLASDVSAQARQEACDYVAEVSTL